MAISADKLNGCQFLLKDARSLDCRSRDFRVEVEGSLKGGLLRNLISDTILGTP